MAFQAGNLGATFNGFAVGDPEWINSQASKVGKYFRSIEYGTSGFIGRKLAGAFSVGPRGFRINPSAVPFGAPTEDESFAPFAASLDTDDLKLGAIRASKYLRQLGFKGGYRTVATVKHEIKPHDAYAKGFAEFGGLSGGAEREIEAVKTAFAEAGLDISHGKSGRTGRQTATKAQSAQLPALSRGGFIAGRALSSATSSLGRFDQVFRAELTKVNKQLALELAEEVAEFYGPEFLKRPDASTGALAEATLAPQNRFPS